MISADRYCSSCGAVNTPEVQVCFACGLSLKITAPLSLETPAKQYPLLQGRYRILEQVGKGGFSAVYKAEDTQFDDGNSSDNGDSAGSFNTGHTVAIKAVTLDGLKPQEVIEATDAFNREMQMLSELKHPDVPRVYGHFSEAECWYLVMDFIEGVRLEKHLETLANEKRMPVDEVLELGLMLCTALEYLHTRQPPVVFRDLKPANVMLKPDGRICLIDFGIARRFRAGQVKDTIPFGSPGYAAPEQYGKAQTTPRTDIYSLGVTLRQLLTGDEPAQNPFHFSPLQLDHQSALSGLEALLMRMVEVDAEKRPASISAIKKELEQIARGRANRHSHGYGQQARGIQKGPQQPVMMSWQTSRPVPSPLPEGKTLYVISGNGATPGNRAQMSQMIMQSQRMGRQKRNNPFRASTVYWSMPPIKQVGNRMASASLAFGLLNLIVPLLLCGVGSYSTSYFLYGSFFLLLPLASMCVLSLLAIIFGHIGKHRAMSVPGWLSSNGSATAGLVMGYIFGVFSFGILLCILINTLSPYGR